MRYTIQPTPERKWAVLDIRTRKPYGDPHETIESAEALAREAEAYAVLDRLTACRAGNCSI